MIKINADVWASVFHIYGSFLLFVFTMLLILSVSLNWTLPLYNHILYGNSLLKKKKRTKKGRKGKGTNKAGADREPYVSNMSYSFHFLSAWAAERAITEQTVCISINTAGYVSHTVQPPHISTGLEDNLLSSVRGWTHTYTLGNQINIHCFWECCCSIFSPLSPLYDMFTKYLFRMRRWLCRALPSSPRGCSAVNGGIICQFWQCLEAASERYKEATDKESIRRAVNCLQSPGAGEYLKSMGLKTD